MVYVFLANGFEIIEALTPVVCLRRAGIEVCTVGVDGEWITGSKDVTVRADKRVEEVELSDAEMLVLPGGLGGVKGISESACAMELLRKAYAAGKRISAICAAPTILAHEGWLNGKKCVCYPDMLDELTKAGGIVCPDAAVVCDGAFITAKAAGASEEFAFALIEALKGKDAVQSVRASICAR